MIDKTGIIPILRNNPIALYTAACHREVYDNLDRVYGIMQVFGYRLGASGSSSILKSKILLIRKKFTLAELELQFSKRLLKDFPVQSQLHTLTSAPKIGQAWRLNPESNIPTFVQVASMYTWINRGPQKNLHPASRERLIPLCEWSTKTSFEVGRRIFEIESGQSSYKTALWRAFHVNVDQYLHRSITWAQVSGKKCSFSTLDAAWKRIDKKRLEEYQEMWPVQEIAMDLETSSSKSTLMIPSLPDFPLVGYEVQVSEQHRLSAALSDQSGQHDLSVLLLGTQKRPSRTLGKTNYGMLVVKRWDRRIVYWRRIGIVRWELFDLPKKISYADKILLEGKSKDWHDVFGLLG
jgi:hypothetical protein